MSEEQAPAQEAISVRRCVLLDVDARSLIKMLRLPEGSRIGIVGADTKAGVVRLQLVHEDLPELAADSPIPVGLIAVQEQQQPDLSSGAVFVKVGETILAGGTFVHPKPELMERRVVRPGYRTVPLRRVK